jgi:hypothetical protein
VARRHRFAPRRPRSFRPALRTPELLVTLRLLCGWRHADVVQQLRDAGVRHVSQSLLCKLEDGTRGAPPVLAHVLQVYTRALSRLPAADLAARLQRDDPLALATVTNTLQDALGAERAS